MHISEVQQAAWRNKLDKGLSTDNVHLEINLLYGEVAEVCDAYRKGSDDLGHELADVLIYLACLAQMTGVDLDRAVREKLDINAARTYRFLPNGFAVKNDGPGLTTDGQGAD
ncbi:MazG nucleotide pyrophosphohydrolase domain-containing protein [Spirillospora sp. NPDC052269]